MKLSLLVGILFAVSVEASVQVGKPAPSFKHRDVITGKKVDLTELRGKVVVMEWFNEGCPFVKKHYGPQNMQGLQKKLTGKDVTWIGVVSSAKGKQGHYSKKEAKMAKKKYGAHWTHFLRDPKGKLGQLYGAKTTPHMFVIDKKGLLAYQGAIDSIPSADPADIPKAKNYVELAVNALQSGKKVAVAKTKAYGCSVKY